METTSPPKSPLTRLIRQPLAWSTLILLLGMSVIVWRLYVLGEQQILAGAVDSAEVYAQTLSDFRSVYTSEVVAPLTEHGLTATHNYRNMPGTIPLPVTLTMVLSESVSSHGFGTLVRLYSEYPFPWRRAEGGPRDAFESEALRALRAQPNKPYYRLEHRKGQPVLRYAIADLMRADCVRCHNNHPDSPRKDWKVGELRGVLEITRPLAAPEALSRSHLQEITWLLIILSFLIVGMVAASLLRMARARAMAEQLSWERALFTAKLAHEIRTPLNGVLGLADLLRYTTLSSKQRSYVNAVRSSALALRSLANQVIDYSSLSAGRTQLNESEFDLHLLVEEAILLKTGTRGGPDFSLSIAPQTPHFVRGDSARLLQVLHNLLSNAQKHADGKGVLVTVGVSSRKEHTDTPLVEFRVKDSGPGLSADEQMRLFQPYSQLRVLREQGRGGAGLGLAICKQIVLAMSGQIGITSEKGSGAEFWFCVPLKVIKTLSGGSSGQLAPVNLSRNSQPSLHHQFPGRRILVVEDDKVSQDVLFGMLTELRAEVDVVSSGEEALALHQLANQDPELRYNAVLLDGHMPGLSGADTARELCRRQRSDWRLPIIAVTADTSPEFRSEAQKSGFDDFLIKPYTLDQLSEVLARWVTGQVMSSATGGSRLQPAADPAIVAEFLRRAPEDLKRLYRAADQGEAPPLTDAAHTLAGSASFVKATEMVRLCRAIESAAREETWTVVAGLCVELEAEWARVRDVLTASLSTGVKDGAETPP